MMVLASFTSLAANLWWVFLTDSCAVADNVCVPQVVVPILLMGIAYGLFAGSAWNALVY